MPSKKAVVWVVECRYAVKPGVLDWWVSWDSGVHQTRRKAAQIAKLESEKYSVKAVGQISALKFRPSRYAREEKP